MNAATHASAASKMQYTGACSAMVATKAITAQIWNMK
jgi:hypothetical protein